jgi:FkbM family methyltransferase
MLKKLTKAARIMTRPRLASALIRHGVAGAIEHLPIIDFVRPSYLIDVGANKGQFALATLSLFPNVKIECFEPLPGPGKILRAWSSRMTDQITLHQCALARSRGRAKFYVTNREDSSSFFEPGAPQKAAGIDVSRTIEVATERLDSVIDKTSISRPSLLKMDVQGGELDVLIGSEGILSSIDFIYLEVSFIPLYKNQPLFNDLYEYLIQRGFVLRGVATCCTDKVRGPTQSDALFCRQEAPDLRESNGSATSG